MNDFNKLIGYSCIINGMKDFRMWLNEELENRGWSYSELARRAGVSQGLVSMVMSGQQEASWEFCARVADALGLPRETVLREAGHLPELPAVERLTLGQVWEMLQQLSSEQLNEVRRYARYLTGSVAGQTYRGCILTCSGTPAL